MMTPDDRAMAIAAMVPNGTIALAEVGYDRGLVLAALRARLGPAPRLVGVEVQPGAAARVPSALAASIDLRTGDGLAPLAPNEVEGVVLAGLGAKTIVSILGARPAVTARLAWVVTCASHFEDELRPGLARLGWHIADERLVFDRGRYYEVVLARPDAADTTTTQGATDSVAARWGPVIVGRPDPLAPAWLADLRHRFREAFAAKLAKTAVGPKLAMIDEVERRVRTGLDLTRVTRSS